MATGGLYEPPSQRNLLDAANALFLGRSRAYEILADYRAELESGNLLPDLAPKKIGNVGRKSELTDEIADQLKSVIKNNRGRITLRYIELEMKETYNQSLAPSTISKYLEEMEISRGRTFLKPTLTNKQTLQRLCYIKEKIRNGKSFTLGKNVIHVDEKWFYLTRDGQWCWYGPEFEMETEKVSHKSHNIKVMFICAIGVPQTYVEKGKRTFFDGKIGCWPFVEETEAKRDSINRPKGTKVLQLVNVTANVYFEMVKSNLLPAVRKKMAWLKNDPIIIQHDGAKPHVGKGNSEKLNDLGGQYGWNITFLVQPPQSPDLNKCDLRFFHSLQRLSDYLRQNASVKDLVDSVLQGFDAYPVEKLTRVHALTFEVYREIIKQYGGNSYKLPHSGIRKRQRRGVQVWDLSISKALRIRLNEEIDRLDKIVKNTSKGYGGVSTNN